MDLLNLTPAQRRTLTPDERKLVTYTKTTTTRLRTLADAARAAVHDTDPDTVAGQRARAALEDVLRWSDMHAQCAEIILADIARNHAARMSG